MSDATELMNVSLDAKQRALRSSAYREDLFARLQVWPPTDAPGKDFIDAFTLIEQIADDSRLALIWTLWSRVDRLEVASRAVSHFARDLSWVRLSDAISIARRFADSMSMFPELAADLKHGELAEQIRSMGNEQNSLYFFALSYLVFPGDHRALERLLLQLAHNKAYAPLKAFLEFTAPTDFDKAFYSRLTNEILGAGGSIELCEVLGLLADKIGEPASLSKQRLGVAISQALVSNSDALGALEPIRLVEIVAGARQKIFHRGVEQRISLRKPDTPDVLNVLDRVQKIIFPFEKGRIVPTGDAKPEGRDRRSGVVSWTDFLLAKGPAWIAASSLRSTYAELSPEGALTAKEHPAGGVFQFGPHISLGSGVYRLVLSGSAAKGLHIQFKVSADCGARSIEALIFETSARQTTGNALCEVEFELESRVEGIEFLLIVTHGVGALAVNGVTLTRKPPTILQSA